MGAVYKAYDTELGRTVALKLVRPELATSPETMQRFKQELLLASKISHKNILRIHDLGDAGGIKFITMALVEGTDLSGLIEKKARLDFDRAMNYTRQLCGRWKRHTTRVWSIAISNRRTSSSTRPTTFTFPISAWPNRWNRKPPR